MPAGERASPPPPTAFLIVIKPEVAIISVGAWNSYGRPAAETVIWFQAVRVKVYGTNLAGS